MSSKYGSERGIHESTQETRERAYERIRSTVLPLEGGGTTTIAPDVARKVADQAARQAHDKLDRR